MKPFAERNHAVIGAVAIGVVVGTAFAALHYDKLPFISSARHYAAYFADASGLQAGVDVQVAGAAVGKVSSISLEGSRVLVDFTVDEKIRLGDRTEAAIKTKSLLGVKTLALTSRGDGTLRQTIPLERTKPAYELTDALSDLSKTISDLNTNDLNASLDTMAQEFASTPPDLRSALDGVTRFSHTLNDRDKELRGLLANARQSTHVLAQRTDQVVTLIANSDTLLHALRLQSAALDNISGNVTELSHQLSAFANENREKLRPALDKLNGVLAILDNRKAKIQESIKLLNPYMMSLGESASSGPFFKPYLANLLPGQFVQPFIEAAFSDLGLDPNVMTPSQRTDPQTGQPGTPPLPVPYPRTGQGGDPRLTLPDAITGNPGDPRYPYRQPPPAPPPGGPPPGPPATSTPEPAATPAPASPTQGAR